MNLTELASSLRVTVSVFHKKLRKQMLEINSYSMTELETIAHLAKNKSLLPTELANLTRVKTQSMSQIINKLELNGIINKTPSKNDKRKVDISLTAFGEEFIEKTKYERDEWLKKAIEQALSTEEKQLLKQALPILHKLIEIA